MPLPRDRLSVIPQILATVSRRDRGNNLDDAGDAILLFDWRVLAAQVWRG